MNGYDLNKKNLHHPFRLISNNGNMVPIDLHADSLLLVLFWGEGGGLGVVLFNLFKRSIGNR